MVTVTSIVKQLKKERDRVERQLSGLNAALSAFAARNAGQLVGSPVTTEPYRRCPNGSRLKLGLTTLPPFPPVSAG